MDRDEYIVTEAVLHSEITRIELEMLERETVLVGKYAELDMLRINHGKDFE